MHSDIKGIKISRKDDTLMLEGFGGERLQKIQAGEMFEQLVALPWKGISELRLKLDNVRSDDHYALAFIDACGKLCGRRHIRLELIGASQQLMDAIKRVSVVEEDARKEKKNQLKSGSAFILAGDATIKFAGDAKDLVGFIGDLAESAWHSLVRPSKIRWREIYYYMDKTGSDAVPIVSLICFLMGVILAFQGIVQMGKFGLKIFVADLVGLAIVKELGPLMVAMICTGRAGSAFAAEIGTMKVNEELDAMETMGLKAARFLVVPKIIALVAMMPLLTVIGDAVGVIGGMLVAVVKGGVAVEEYYLRTIHAMTPMTMTEGLVKSVVFAALIAAIGCFRGFQADNDAKGVGRATTSAVVSGIFLVVLADAFITMLFN